MPILSKPLIHIVFILKHRRVNSFCFTYLLGYTPTDFFPEHSPVDFAKRTPRRSPKFYKWGYTIFNTVRV